MLKRARLWVAGVVTVLLPGCVPSPLLWSPDGKWLAYTMAVRPADRVLAPGWLWEPAPGAGSPGRAGAAAGTEAGGRARGEVAYRLWATRVEDGASVLLEEGRGPLTSPGWSPDGSALAFGRLVPLDDGGARYEIVVQEAPDRQRVLHASRLGALEAAAEGLPGLAVCWSPDGRHLAVPQFQPPGLAVLRADNGHVLKVVKDAA
jgi:Tol biopolymer transport system component